jgi:predicted alpha/beta hydrolase family esterase
MSLEDPNPVFADGAASALADAAFDFVIVPGLRDSGQAHWQSVWHTRFPGWHRVTQQDWERPDIDAWLAATERALSRCTRPAVLVAHSFGSLASTLIASRHPDRVAAVLLVAPADPARFGLGDLLPQGALPVPTTFVASRNDPWLRYEWAAIWAQRWGSQFVDLGTAGHVNADSGYGPWPGGLPLLAALAARAGSKASSQRLALAA